MNTTETEYSTAAAIAAFEKAVSWGWCLQEARGYASEHLSTNKQDRELDEYLAKRQAQTGDKGTSECAFLKHFTQH